MINNQTDQKLWTREFVFLLLLSASYFYCLPLLRTSVILGITASEIRIYDLLFIFGFLVLILPKISNIFTFWSRYSKAHKFLLLWVVLGGVGLFITLLNNDRRFLIGAIRYFRFVSFALAFVIGFLYIRNRRQALLLFDVLLSIIVIISIIGSLQGRGILPNFWPDYYSIYWEGLEGYMATATLSPNHTHYSLVMAFGIVMVFARINISSTNKALNMFYLVGLLPMVYSMIASKGRSGWLAIGVYLVYMLIFSKSNRGLIVAVMIAFAILANSNLDIKAGNSTVREILLYRSVSTVKQTNRSVFDAFEDNEENWIEKVDDSRWNIYVRSVSYLLDNPVYLLIGAGFQNASQGIGKAAIAAHNAYLNIVAEHGVFGLAIYLMFLLAIFNMAIIIRKKANSKASYYLASHWLGIYLGLLAANFFGEIIYPGRALFTFLGTFFIMAALFLHPVWRNPKQHSLLNGKR